LSERTCLHPLCGRIMTKRRQTCCGRHWYRLPEEMRQRHRYAREYTARRAIEVEMLRYFEARVIGPHEVIDCQGPDCDGRFVYLETQNGHHAPVDHETVQSSDSLFDVKRHVSHFATCKNPEIFRRRQ